MFNPNLEVLWRPSMKPFPGKNEHVAWFEIFIVDIFKRTNSKTVRRFRITFLRHRRIDWWGLQTVAFKQCFPVKARLVLASKTVAQIRTLEAAAELLNPSRALSSIVVDAQGMHASSSRIASTATLVMCWHLPATYRLIEYDISLGLESIQKDINNIIVKCRTARHSETTS